MADTQLETAASICILPHTVGIRVSNCDCGKPKEKIPRTKGHAGFQILGWLMGLEPTTTGITILDSTN